MGKHKLPSYVLDSNYICEYGCEQRANYKLGNGKWCCSPRYHQCPVKRKVQRNAQKNREDRDLMIKRGKTLGESNIGRQASKETSIKLGEIRKKFANTKIEKQKRRKIQLDYHARMTKKEKENYSYLRKNTLEKLKEKHPFLLVVEDLREDPVTKKLQGRCKNHECPNSKEKDGWFTLHHRQLEARLQAIEKPYGFEENNFYCSENCKNACPLFGLQHDPFKTTNELYTLREYKIFKQEVLKRQREELGYNECEYCGNRNINELVVHHEKPQKTHPYLTLDPDNGIIVCGATSKNKCHYKYGHKTGTNCSTGKLASMICY